MAGHHAYSIHDDKIINEEYKGKLAKISSQMTDVEKQYGLKEGEFWLTKDGPPEWQELVRRWDEESRRLLQIEVRKLDLRDLSDLFRDDRTAFEEAYEQGRRAIFHKDDVRNSVARLIGHYENEAKRSESADAPYAAMVMYGSACEARLLLRVLDAPSEAEAARRRLPSKIRPANDPMKWGLDNLIKIGVEAGWLVGRDEEDIELPLEAWAQTLRIIRNLLHPGRHALDHPHVAVGDTQVHDARSIYTVICRALVSKGQQKKGGAFRPRPSKLV